MCYLINLVVLRKLRLSSFTVNVLDLNLLLLQDCCWLGLNEMLWKTLMVESLFLCLILFVTNPVALLQNSAI